MILERWATIADFPDYEVSDRGRVRRRTGGRGVRAGRVLKPQPHPQGYVTVSLYRGTRKTWRRTIHSLVASAFLGPRPAGHVADHDDGDKTNNHVGNLEWVTQRVNLERARVRAYAARASA